MSAIILTGGKSKRMGYDKTSILLNDSLLIEKTISSLKVVFPDIIVCGKLFKDNHNEDIRYVEDIFIDAGPIGGIFSGLYYSNDDINFIIACDIPDINTNIIEYMKKSAQSYDAVILQINGYYEPLFGFYSKRTLPIFKTCIENGIYKITEAFKSMKMRIICEDELKKIVPTFQGLYNINTKDDLIEYKNRKIKIVT